MAQMVGSTSAPVIVRLGIMGGVAQDGRGNAVERTACVLVGETLDDYGSVSTGYADALM